MRALPGGFRRRLGTREAEVVREGEHPLLGTVVEVAFEASTLSVGCGGDPSRVTPEAPQSGEHLGVKALVFDCEACSGPDLACETGSVDLRVVNRGGDHLSGAGHGRHSVVFVAGGIPVSMPRWSTIRAESLSR